MSTVEVPMDQQVHQDPDGRALFNPAAFDTPELRLDRVDGHQVGRIALKFAGTVVLDRSLPADVALYRALQLGEGLTLEVEAVCVAQGGKAQQDDEGNMDTVLGERTLKITGIVPTE